MTVKEANRVKTLKKVNDVLIICERAGLQLLHTPKMIFDEDVFEVEGCTFKFQVNDLGIVYAIYYKKNGRANH